MGRLLRWITEPQHMAGALLLTVPLALYSGTVIADVLRAQKVPAWPILALCLLGLVAVRGWNIDRVKVGADGVDIDIDESEASGDEDGPDT